MTDAVMTRFIRDFHTCLRSQLWSASRTVRFTGRITESAAAIGASAAAAHATDVAIKTQAKTAKLTTRTLQISPPSKNLLKIILFALPGGALLTFFYKLCPKFFFRPGGGCTCTQCTPSLRP